MMDATERTYKVALSPVMDHKIAQGDMAQWRTFNGSFSNQDLPQLQIASALYDGHAITTWHNKHWRDSKNYQCGQHLGIDFDTEDQRSAIPTLLKDSFVRQRGAFVYTTLSHTPDAPRARAIFLLDQPIHQAGNYALAAAALLWLFSAGDRQCKDPARFFYGGRPGACEMEWPAQELPLDIVKDLIKRYQETGLRERHKVNARYAGQTPDETEVVNALKRIDPWAIDYDQWLAVLMAIHSAYPNDTGLTIAEQWGQGAQGEVGRKWRGFKGEGNVQGRVGIGSVFALAKEHGWIARA